MFHDDCERMNETAIQVAQLSTRNRADTASTAVKRSRRTGRCCQQRGSTTHPGRDSAGKADHRRCAGQRRSHYNCSAGGRAAQRRRSTGRGSAHHGGRAGGGTGRGAAHHGGRASGGTGRGAAYHGGRAGDGTAYHSGSTGGSAGSAGSIAPRSWRAWSQRTREWSDVSGHFLQQRAGSCHRRVRRLALHRQGRLRQRVFYSAAARDGRGRPCHQEA